MSRQGLVSKPGLSIEDAALLLQFTAQSLLATLNFDFASEQIDASHTLPTAQQHTAPELTTDGRARDGLANENGGGTRDLVDAGHGSGNGVRAGLNGTGHHSGSLPDSEELQIQVCGIFRTASDTPHTHACIHALYFCCGHATIM